MIREPKKTKESPQGDGATATKRKRTASVLKGDARIGFRLRMRRVVLGMSQSQLGEAIGVSFQQVQKYERGINRISAGTLHAISHALNVPISFFFDYPAAANEIPDQQIPEPNSSRDLSPGHWDAIPNDTIELVKCFSRIPNEATRDHLLDLITAIARSIERRS